MLDELLKLLEGKQLREIAEGANVPYNWLWRVVNRKVSNPQLARLERIKAFLDKATA